MNRDEGGGAARRPALLRRVASVARGAITELLRHALPCRHRQARAAWP